MQDGSDWASLWVYYSGVQFALHYPLVLQALFASHSSQFVSVLLVLSHHFEIYSKGSKDTWCTCVLSTVYSTVPNKQSQWAISRHDASASDVPQNSLGLYIPLYLTYELYLFDGAPFISISLYFHWKVSSSRTTLEPLTVETQLFTIEDLLCSIECILWTFVVLMKYSNFSNKLVALLNSKW